MKIRDDSIKCMNCHSIGQNDKGQLICNNEYSRYYKEVVTETTDHGCTEVVYIMQNRWI